MGWPALTAEGAVGQTRAAASVAVVEGTAAMRGIDDAGGGSKSCVAGF